MDRMMYIHRQEVPMAATTAFRHKHLRIDQLKLDRARRILEAETETETLDRALAIVVSEARIDAVLRRAGGRGKLQKVFD